MMLKKNEVLNKITQSWKVKLQHNQNFGTLMVWFVKFYIHKLFIGENAKILVLLPKQAMVYGKNKINIKFPLSK